MYGLNLLLLLMAAGASDLVFGSGIVTGIGQTEAAGTKHASGHAIVTGIGEPRAVSSEDFEGFGVVTGIGITEAAGVKRASGHGTVDGIGEALATGAKSVEGSVEVVGISDMDATGIKASFQSVITTGIGLPVGIGSKAVSGFAEVTGIGRIIADGFVGGVANRITASGNLRVTLDGDRRAYIAEQQAGGHVIVTGIGTGDVEGTKHTEGFAVVSGIGVPVAEGLAPLFEIFDMGEVRDAPITGSNLIATAADFDFGEGEKRAYVMVRTRGDPHDYDEATLTIGGVTATLIAQCVDGEKSVNLGLWQLDTSEEVADIVLTSGDGGFSLVSFRVYSAYNVQNGAVFNVGRNDLDSSGSSISTSVDTADNSFVIGAHQRNGLQGGGGWTGISGGFATGSAGWGWALDDDASEQSGRSISVSWSGNVSWRRLLAVCIRK